MFSVNLFGMDNMGTSNGDIQNGGYPKYPTVSDVESWLALNATLFRFPVMWNYLQTDPFNNGPLVSDVVSHLDKLIDRVTTNESHQAYAIIDVV